MINIYKFKATIAESKLFFRIYELRGDMTLFSLHKFITSDLEFAPDQMFAFKSFSKDSMSQSTYGLVNYGSGTVDGVTIDDVLRKGERIILYIYDIKRSKFIQLAYVEQIEQIGRLNYPRLVEESGGLPNQFSSNKHIDQLNKSSDPEDDINDEGLDEAEEENLQEFDDQDDEIFDDDSSEESF